MSFTKEQSSVGAHCPFCGDERNIVEIGVPFDDGICHVECARCGAHGPVESAEDRAISAWNLRAGGPVERPALNTKQFSREELETLVCLSAFESNPVVRLAQVAAFALAQMERAENAEADIQLITAPAESTGAVFLAMGAGLDRLKGELAEAEEAIRRLLSLPQCKPITGEAVMCVACGQRKAPIGRDAPSILHLCDHECVGYKADPRPGFLWPGETLEDFGYPEEAARADGDLRVMLQHPAVRRARERGK